MNLKWVISDASSVNCQKSCLRFNLFLVVIVNAVFEVFVNPVGICNVFRTKSISERDENDISQFMISNNPTIVLINKFNIAMKLSISRSLQ